MQKYYKYQYRFNASHSFDYVVVNAHMHTFTVTIYVSRRKQADQILFFDIDRVVKEYLEQFEGCYLNEKIEFKNRVPNIENMGDIFYEELKECLSRIGIELYQLDISENPLSIYQVSSRIHLPACYLRETKMQ